MKYSRLTKEQFEALHEEFAKFLATQSIDQAKWEYMKKEQPQLVEEELDVFSDLIWDKTLKQVSFLENLSPSQIFLFSIQKEQMELRVLKTTQGLPYDLSTAEGWEWAMTHLHDANIDVFTSSKKFGLDREKELFYLIQQGCILTEGERYRQLDSFFRTAKK